jgi:hypothetical protein
MKRLPWRIALAALALTTLAGLGSRAYAANACLATADFASRSCVAGVQSDKLLALGKCANLLHPVEKVACEQQAAADATDALLLCDQQDDLRGAVCTRLGPAPYVPVIDPAHFVATIDNPFSPLKPGTTFIYEGQTVDGFEHVEFAVTHQTRVILGVTCVEVHDTRELDGVLTEDTRDWFAQDKAGNVWYFGENTALISGGLPVDLSGTWTGGKDGAQPGIVMKAHPAIRDFYRQEFLLGEAEDLAEVSSLTETVTVPFPPGTFKNCLKTIESSPLAPGDVASKFYCAGIGNVLTVEPNGDRSELVQIRTR